MRNLRWIEKTEEETRGYALKPLKKSEKGKLEVKLFPVPEYPTSNFFVS